MALQPGSQLGAYKILGPLGAGGMGEVYRAVDTRLDRDVAIKVLATSFANDQDRLRRFEQEARATSALNHPNILTIYDIGTHEDSPYIVAELLEGADLRAHLNDGALNVRRAIDYAQQIARGLAAAHEKGVVHRDLKPENLFITKDGRVKVLDFGLSKLTQPRLARVDPEAPTSPLQTESGVLIGTVFYMSPEQTRGEKADYRADIFAFGAVLYEMVTGERPFQGASAVEVLHAILKEEPPKLSESNRPIPPLLERIVRRCLEKDPDQRFQSTTDLGFALEALSEPTSSRIETVALGTATESTGKTRSFGNARLAWLVAAVFILGMLGFAWAYFTRQPSADARVMKFSILPPENTNFGSLAISPDGRWLAFTAAMGAKVQLWLRALDGTEAKALPGTEGAILPFWSPDSRWIGFFAIGKLKKIEVSGGHTTTVCDAGVGTGGAWNRDGLILFSVLGGAGLSRVASTAGEVTSVMRPDPARAETNYTNPCFLPDGRHFIFSIFSGQKESRGIYLGSLAGGVKQRLLGDDSNAVYTSGSDGGFLIFGREGALMSQPFDPIARQITGEPVPLSEKVGTVFDGTAAVSRRNVSASDNGGLVFDPILKRQRNQLIWVDRAGRKTQSLDGVDNTTSLWLSTDDHRFMVTRFDFKTANNDLWLSDETGGNVTRFTFNPGNDQSPVWSPDGSRVVWASNREGLFQLYEKAVSGAGQDVPFFKSDYFIFPTDWSRDGRFIIYRQIHPITKYDVWVLPVGSSPGNPFPFLQTAANEAAAVLSPDGRWMAYSSDESGMYEVYVQNFPGGGGTRQVSAGGGIGPHWRGDGKELFYHAPDGKLMSATVKAGASLETGAPVELFEFRDGGSLISPYYSVTRDGQRFLLSTIVETEAGAPVTVVVNWAAEMKR